MSPFPWWDVTGDAPIWVAVTFWAIYALVTLMFVQAIAIGVSAARHALRHRRRRAATGAGTPNANPGPTADDFLWVFLVPALNEEVTIRDSVSRLEQVDVAHRVIVVIDDGSDDRTGDILAGMNVPGLRVLTRRAPNARRGKAAALNAAYFHVRDTVLAEPEFAAFDTAHVIVGVVDADGRLDPAAPRVLATRFADVTVGGAQVLVRIYNRKHPLACAQDLEFGIFGHVVQAGRSSWGSANMGGNGQFNRLAALEQVATGAGPWRDRLTEDQDLGVRLVQHGWRSIHENRVTVEQQGLSSLRRLYRQRTRWAQGAWQAIGLSASVRRMPHALYARLDALLYLLTPIVQLLVAADLVFDFGYTLIEHESPLAARLLIALVVFTPSIAAVLPAAIVAGARRRGVVGVLWGIVVGAVLYPIYTWLLVPTLFHALIRQLCGVTSWTKTAREAIA
ncbi:glycosyltransferase [Gryllotalpicola protaetiae]|uniref:Glycosyltransferase n=1 Tax=Gryllotalpicola protaetiae TaxID=2419771 RepID=A0A387BSY1_9MICO|nr:glycosyltransferase [Gryllotalpicola protaetiae]AYG04170.1 glycosyltransferase [Gryllotalpicola protaetiae]